METEIVIDTSVILDIVITSRPRHKFGKLIGMYLIDNKISIKVPMYAMFEIKSGLLSVQQQEIQKGGAIRINEDVSESTPLKYNPVPIDQAFFDRYFDPDIPGIKPGDYIYVAMAKKDRLILLTEDMSQYYTAKEAGVQVYNSEEYRNICMLSLI